MNAWGVLGKPTPEKVQEWMNMPYGMFKEMVTTVNKKTKGKPLRRHTVEIKDITTSYRSVFVEVEAASNDHAIELVSIVDKNTLNWSEPKQENNKYSYRVSQIWN